ncbi:MAG: hypothetical protein EPO00_09660 [Chloroflexota bacterium]|nr:MAG: hypothetical protein EPO00_09660 [Chloroflexota bacterium]
MKRRIAVVGSVLALILVVSACSSAATNSPSSSSSTSAGAASTYTPQTRTIEMVTIQELIGEFANIPDLKDETDKALASGGPLDGHEVYAWYPNSLTAYVGDTIKITIHNAQGDEHIFALPDFGVTQTIAPDSTATVTFTVTKPTISQFICAVPEHTPWMQGWLTVLPDSAAG